MQPPSQDDTQPPIQFANQAQFQHLQPQMMLCPVQFIYEPQIMIPPDEPAPPNQTPTYQNQGYLLNVQNTPPWIQNRTNMVYMPQVQMNNMQPYIPQQMVQNPMFNYQYQPMIMHDQRHIPYMNQNVMQSPQMVQSVVQSPQSLPQNMMQNSPIQNSNAMNTQQQNIQIMQSPMRLQMEQKQESPLLNQMLQNNAPKPAQTQQEYMAPMQIIKPQYQSVRPQMIIVNPITHTCMRNQKDPSVTTEKKTEIPLQIRSQIPEGLSVKTVFKLSSTALVRPTDFVQNIAPVDEAHPRVYPKPVVKPASNRDPQTNYKRKIREIIEQNTKDENEVQGFKRNFLVNKQEAINKHNAVSIVANVPITNAYEAQNFGSLSIRPQNEQMKLQQDQGTFTDRLQVKDKMLRNTVYVQARGIVNEPPNNEMQNTSISNNQNSTIKVRFGVPIEKALETAKSMPVLDVVTDCSTEERGQAIGVNNSPNENSSKLQDDLPNDSCSITQNDSIMTETMPTCDANTQDNPKTTNASTSHDVDIARDMLIIQLLPSIDADTNRDNSKTTQLSNSESDDAKVQKNLKMAEFQHHNDNRSQNKSKLTLLSNGNESDDTKVQKNLKITQFLHSDDADGTLTRNNSKMTEILLSKNADSKVSQKEPKMKSKELKSAKKENKLKKQKTDKMIDENVSKKEKTEMYVLTHVLDGYIIQESNVPFIIAKPTLTRKKKSIIDDITSTIETEPASKIEDASMTEDKTKTEMSLDKKTEVHTAEAEINDEIEQVNASEMAGESEAAQLNEDDPFGHLSISTVKSWTVSDLTTHLMDYDTWQDSAQKLLEEEIDGESLLLVNKEQLIQIGISEDHAEVLSAFLERGESKK